VLSPSGRSTRDGDVPARARKHVPLLGAVAVIFLIAVFLVDVTPRASSAFGDSVEAMNAGTWLVGGRSLAEEGPTRSHLGATSPELGTYAHHPPGVVLAGVVSERMPGDVPILERLPAVIASIAAIVLLHRLLRTSGFATTASVAGVAVVVGSPMFLIFGSMMNMEAISLPFVLWFLCCWQRRFDRVAVAGVAAFCAAITSWQGLLIVALVGFVTLVRALRRRRVVDPALVALAVGFGAACALTLGSLWWANGGLAAVGEAAGKRQDITALTPSMVARRQLHYLRETFPAWTVVLAVPGAFVALLDHRARGLFAVTSLTVVVFIVGFLEGSYEHVFWNWWIVLPFALAVATLADRITRLADRRRAGRIVRAVLLVGSLAAVAVVATWTTTEERSFWSGVPAGQLLETTPLPADQHSTYFFYGDEWATWVSWYTHRPVTTVWTSSELRELARYEPDHLVLVRRRWPFDDAERWRRVEGDAVASRADSYALVRVRDMVGLAQGVGL
jgi:hypothetical protein